MQWEDGAYWDTSVSVGAIEYAKPYEEIKGAFFIFRQDADQLYVGWKVIIRALGQISCYSSCSPGFSVDGEMLSQSGRHAHVLVQCIVQANAGYDYLVAAAHFAAEPFAGANANLHTTDDFRNSSTTSIPRTRR